MTDKISLMMDNRAFTKKPTGDDASGIQKNRIYKFQVDVGVKQLADSLTNGYTVSLGRLKKGSRSNTLDNWYSQQAIFLDFDNASTRIIGKEKHKFKDIQYTIAQARADPFFQEHAAFMYETFNHTEDWNKFRVAFILDKPVYDLEVLQEIYDKQLNQRYGHMVDNISSQGVRLFYGGNNLHVFNYNNRLRSEVKSDHIGFKVYMGRKLPSLSSSEPSTQETVPKRSKHSSHLELIKSKNIKLLIENIPTSPIVVHSDEQARDYLKKQSLLDYLGVNSKSIYDIFHDEAQPSASLFKSDTGTGHWLYKCHSDSRPFVGTIFTITERLLDCTALQARQFLQEVYQVEVLETDRQKQLKAEIEEYKALLRSEELEVLYPDFYKLMNRYGHLEDFYILLDIVKENIPSDIENDDLRLIFHHSMKTLSQRFGRGLTSTKTRIGFFTFFKMIYKLPENEVPKELLNKQKRNKGRKRHKYLNSTYELKLYKYDFFDELNSACADWESKGMTSKSINREGILRNYGIEEANRVFPQTIDNEIPELNHEIVSYIEQVMLEKISNKGWTYEKEILESVVLYFKGQKSYKSNMYKRCLGEMITKYDLQIVKCSKRFKEVLDISEDQLPITSYPKLILKK